MVQEVAPDPRSRSAQGIAKVLILDVIRSFRTTFDGFFGVFPSRNHPPRHAQTAENSEIPLLLTKPGPTAT